MHSTLKSKGNVPGAILGGLDLDAASIDLRTVVFADASPLPIGGPPEDVNGDGLPDIVLHFRTQDLKLRTGDTEARLNGKTWNNQAFTGCDTVRIAK
jgi:hypothetical protein